MLKNGSLTCTNVCFNSIGNFLSISLQKMIGLRNALILLHWMNSFSLLMELFAGAELVLAHSLTF
jgi:hypothetical protein